MKIIRVLKCDAPREEWFAFGRHVLATEPINGKDGSVKINSIGKPIDNSEAEKLISDIKKAIRYTKTGKWN